MHAPHLKLKARRYLNRVVSIPLSRRQTCALRGSQYQVEGAVRERGEGVLVEILVVQRFCAVLRRKELLVLERNLCRDALERRV